jgi:hypothetical protein
MEYYPLYRDDEYQLPSRRNEDKSLLVECRFHDWTACIYMSQSGESDIQNLGSESRAGIP